MQAKDRNIALDLYRFLCMFLITTTHITGYSNLIEAVSPGHFNFYFLHILYALQRFSITGFVLISAYFLVDVTNTAGKIIRFWLQLIFFSLAIFGFACLLDPGVFSLKQLIKAAFPVLTYHYWYPVIYLVLLIFAPVLNKFIKTLTKTELLGVILSLGFVVSVFFSFNPFIDEELFLGHPSHGLIWFLLLYLIAAYLRLYGMKKPVLCGPVSFCIFGILLFFLFLLRRFAINTSNTTLMQLFEKVDLLSYNSALPLLLSVSSFITFLHLKISFPKWLTRVVCFLVPTTFGIYLVQEHNALRNRLWSFFSIQRFGQTPWLLPMILAVFFAIWIVAIAVYFLYRLVHKLLLSKLENRILRLISRPHRK